MLTSALFDFLADLKANNTREWFAENKDRYEAEVREPLLGFVRAFEPRLEEISPYFLAIARKSGGALFRIHRDVRFSNDKSPYKTNAALHFRHENGKDVHCPGFYLHLAPEECFCGAGLWRPDSSGLKRIREFIVDKPARWKQATDGLENELHGDTLKRAPKGFDPDHPMIDALRRKDHVVMMTLKPADVVKRDFLDRYVEQCHRYSPYVRYLCEALGQPY